MSEDKPLEAGLVVVTTPPCPVCQRRGEVTVRADGLASWMAGEVIQVALPDLTAEQRELMITGTHGRCWDELTGGDEDGS